MTAGKPLCFNDPEPWETPVDGAELLDTIAAHARRYLILPDGAAEAIALFVLLTYTIDASECSPILAFTSPVKGCGKTRALDLLGALVACPLRTANLTPAAIFRTIEQQHITLLMDEYDTYITRNDELRGILNSGHTKGSAFVLRNVKNGDDWETKQFSTWCPKVLAGIGALPPTLQDRSIEIPMKRKERNEDVARLRQATIQQELESIPRQAAHWAADGLEALRNATPEPIDDFGDRQNDNWEPLLAIADDAGADWPSRARRAARALHALRHDGDDDLPLQLLADIRQVFAECGNRSQLPTETILNVLCGSEDRPWGEMWPSGRAMSPNMLAKMLRPFGVRPRKFRAGPDTHRGYLLADFEDAWTRYLDGGGQPEQVER
jgi:putative DNA primase/helicase